MNEEKVQLVSELMAYYLEQKKKFSTFTAEREVELFDSLYDLPLQEIKDRHNFIFNDKNKNSRLRNRI